MKIQALLAAIAMKLKKLATTIMLLLAQIIKIRPAQPNPEAT